MMNKQIFAATGWRNKSETFLNVEPLNFSLRQAQTVHCPARNGKPGLQLGSLRYAETLNFELWTLAGSVPCQ